MTLHDDQLSKARLGKLYGEFGDMLTGALARSGAYYRVEPNFALSNGLVVTCAGYTAAGDLHIYHVTNPASTRSQAVLAEYPFVRMLGFDEVADLVRSAARGAEAVRTGVAALLARAQVFVVRAGQWFVSQLASCLTGNAINIVIAAIVAFVLDHQAEIAALVH